MALPTRENIAKRLADTLELMVAETFGPVPDPPSEVKVHLDKIVAKREYTVRDGMLTLLAMAVEHGAPLDWTAVTVKGSPARSASRDLGSVVYPRLHITGSPEALQTGVKGTGTYMDRSNVPWRGVLQWASAQTDVAPIASAFEYLAAAVAATARNLPEMPPLDTPRLTFPAVFALVDGMLAVPSGGAHEQFVFAALLEAWREQLGEPGVVETKNLHGSDASAGTAADVQEKYRGQIMEAYEVTAESYSVKIDPAKRTLSRHDLRRIHILAKGVAKASGAEIAADVPAGLDITVLDVREETRSLLSRLGKPGRRFALERLYALLVAKQPNDALVRSYVAGLKDLGLIEQS